MTRKPLLLLAALLVLPCLAEDGEEPRLHFPLYGFSIAPLEGVSDAEVQTAVHLFLPPSEEFAPNVNVQLQAYPGTLQEYAEISRAQFKQFKLKLLAEQTTETTLTWEYSGSMGGPQLRFYAKAERVEGKVYLVTGTSRVSQWNAAGDKIKACVDSFRLRRKEPAEEGVR